MITFTNPVSEKIWQTRYQKNNETYNENLERVAKFCSNNEKEFNDFYNLMKNKLFFPAGRTMSNCGIGKDLTLNNCFTAGSVPDDLSGIFDYVKLGALTHQKGGGIGYDFSKLRPKGSKTSNDAIASGVVSFIQVFDAQTETILQGNRRGANMGVLNVHHPDIIDFITAKSKNADFLKHFNLSVMIDDKFMKAVENDFDTYLFFPVYDERGKILNPEDPHTNFKYLEKIKAKKLWDLIMKTAYDTGEPGVFFYDNLNNQNNIWYDETITLSNPCGEYVAGIIWNDSFRSSDEFGGACNLGSLILPNFVENPFTDSAKLDLKLLSKTVKTAVRFLDNIIDKNNYPDKRYENYQKKYRTIGLGYTGLADMLAMLNIKYGSKYSLEYVDTLCKTITLNAYKASIELSKEKGAFSGFVKDLFNSSKFVKKLNIEVPETGIRNAKLISVAPCGTLSLTYGNNCSSGIEPIFELEYDRNVKIGGQDENQKQTVHMMDYAYQKWQEMKSIKNSDLLSDFKKECFKTVKDLKVEDHINMLGVVSKWVDMSVSKTINIPENYEYEDYKNVFCQCWEKGIKGCTVYRPNKIRGNILISQNETSSNYSSDISEKNLPRGFVKKIGDEAIGLERHLTTGCGSLHCSAFFDACTGELLETYLSKGSKGGCLSSLSGISRLISLSARGGISIENIIDQLNSSIQCPSYAVRRAKKKDTSCGSSCPSAVGHALKDMYDEIISYIRDDKDIEEEDINPKESENKNDNVLVNQEAEESFPCPECNESLIKEGNCMYCPSCGWSKCS